MSSLHNIHLLRIGSCSLLKWERQFNTVTVFLSFSQLMSCWRDPQYYRKALPSEIFSRIIISLCGHTWPLSLNVYRDHCVATCYLIVSIYTWWLFEFKDHMQRSFFKNEFLLPKGRIHLVLAGYMQFSHKNSKLKWKKTFDRIL